LIDQIIEGGSKIETNLAQENAKFVSKRDISAIYKDVVRFIGVHFQGNGISLRLKPGLDALCKISKVFFCPIYPCKSGIEGMESHAVPQDQPKSEFDEQETQRRFEAALRGARTIGPTPMKRRPKTQRNPRKKPKSSA